MFHLKREKMQTESDIEQLKKNPPFLQVKEDKIKNIRHHLKTNPVAVDIFLFLAQYMGRDNIVVCPMNVLMEETEKARTTVYRAVKYLDDNELIVAIKLGNSKAYALNGEYVWKTSHHPGRYIVFENAKALASKQENKKIMARLSHVFERQNQEMI